MSQRMSDKKYLFQNLFTRGLILIRFFSDSILLVPRVQNQHVDFETKDLYREEFTLTFHNSNQLFKL